MLCRQLRSVQDTIDSGLVRYKTIKMPLSSVDGSGKMLMCFYCFDASRLALRNSFIIFSISRETLRARAPAALFPVSACAVASFWKASYDTAIFSSKVFILFNLFVCNRCKSTKKSLNCAMYQNVFALFHEKRCKKRTFE